MAGPWEAYQDSSPDKPVAKKPWEAYAASPAEEPPGKPGSMQGGGGGFWASAADFFKSIPQGIVRGASSAASALGQSEESLATGGGQQTVPGPEESAKLAGVDRLPQPQGMAGRFGGAIGEAIGNPSSYMSGPPGVAGGLAALGAASGGQAGAEMFPKSGAAPVIGGMIGGGVPGMARGIGTLAQTRGRGAFPMPPQGARGAAERDAAVKTLKSFQVEPTAGDVLGSKPLRQAERLGDQPGGGGTYERNKIGVEEQITDAGLRAMGEQPGQAISPELYKSSGERIGRMFDEAAAKFNVKEADVGKQLEGLERQIANEVPFMNEGIPTKLRNIINAFHPQRNPGSVWFVPKGQKGRQMTGDMYKTITEYDSPLSRMIRDGDTTERYYGLKIRGILDDALENSVRSSGQRDAIAKLKEARNQWFAREMIMKSRADATAGRRQGLLDPGKLARNMASKDNGAYMRQGTPLHRLAEAASRVVEPYKETTMGAGHEAGSIPTGARHTGAAVGGAIGAGAGAVAGGPAAAAAGSLAGAATGFVSPGLLGRFVNMPAVQRYLKNGDYIQAAIEAKKLASEQRGRGAFTAPLKGVVGAAAANRKERRERPRVYEE